MSRVTVIFEDDVIVVDGKPASFPKGEVVPASDNYTAIQWYGDETSPYGIIEVKKGDRVWFENLAIVQPYIDQHSPRFEELDAARIAREEAAAKVVADAEQSIAEAEAAKQNQEAAASEQPTP